MPPPSWSSPSPARMQSPSALVAVVDHGGQRDRHRCRRVAGGAAVAVEVDLAVDHGHGVAEQTLKVPEVGCHDLAVDDVEARRAARCRRRCPSRAVAGEQVAVEVDAGRATTRVTVLQESSRCGRRRRRAAGRRGVAALAEGGVVAAPSRAAGRRRRRRRARRRRRRRRGSPCRLPLAPAPSEPSSTRVAVADQAHVVAVDPVVAGPGVDPVVAGAAADDVGVGRAARAGARRRRRHRRSGRRPRDRRSRPGPHRRPACRVRCRP